MSLSVSFSQTENDLSEIIKLVVREYKTDTINVYSRFENAEMRSALDDTKTGQDMQISELYNSHFDSVAPRIYDDTVTIRFYKLKVLYSKQKRFTKKTDNKKIRRYLKSDFEKRRRKGPVAFISIPLISMDNEKAIVFGSYYCGSLCGSGGTFFFQKVNGVWTLMDYERRWVA